MAELQLAGAAEVAGAETLHNIVARVERIEQLDDARHEAARRHLAHRLVQVRDVRVEESRPFGEELIFGDAVRARRVAENGGVAAAGEFDASETIIDAVDVAERARHANAARAARVEQRVIDIPEDDRAHVGSID